MSDNHDFIAGESREGLESGDKSLASIVGRIAYSISLKLSPGDVAELRRLTPSDPFSPAFFKLMVSEIQPDWRNLSQDHARDEYDKRWAVFLQAAAVMKNLHSMNTSLGHALASAGYSELRLIRLLRARENVLFKEVRTAAHYLAAKANVCNLVDIASLLMVLNEGTAESVRKRIACDFYRFETR